MKPQNPNNKPCVVCGTTVPRSARRKFSDRVACSIECKAKARTAAAECRRCGQRFTYDRFKAKAARVYCSLECSFDGRETVACEQCGKPFTKYRSKRMRFCSRVCAGKAGGGCIRNLKRGWQLKREMREIVHNGISKGRASRLRSKYGLKVRHYREMMDKQDGKCAICGCEPESGLVVDHCHESGAVRGLLCGGCNSGLGFMRDDPCRLRSAAKYVAKHAKRNSRSIENKRKTCESTLSESVKADCCVAVTP